MILEKLKPTLKRKLYSNWCYIWLILPGITILPFQLLFLLNKKTHYIAHQLYRVWAWIMLPMCFLPVTVINKNKKLPKNGVYCINHTSYLDIPTLYRSIPGFFSIVGKKEITGMPLIGYVFKRLYISVDRTSLESKRQTLSKCKQALKSGRPMAIFPEGRINSAVSPNLSPFQDGAFIMAIDQQLPIIPITIPYNWIILPGNQRYLKQGHIKAIIHEPIETLGLTISDVNDLKEKVYQVIDTELKKY